MLGCDLGHVEVAQAAVEEAHGELRLVRPTRMPGSEPPSSDIARRLISGDVTEAASCGRCSIPLPLGEAAKGD